MADELSRIRKYEKLGNLHMKAAHRALKQFQLANSPNLKFRDAVTLWSKAGDCFLVAGEFEDAARAFRYCGEYCYHTISRERATVEAALYYLRSAEATRRVDGPAALDAYRRASAIFYDAGRCRLYDR